MSIEAIFKTQNKILQNRIAELEEKLADIYLVLTDEQVIELGGGVEKCQQAAEESRLRFLKSISEVARLRGDARTPKKPQPPTTAAG